MDLQAAEVAGHAARLWSQLLAAAVDAAATATAAAETLQGENEKLRVELAALRPSGPPG